MRRTIHPIVGLKGDSPMSILHAAATRGSMDQSLAQHPALASVNHATAPARDFGTPVNAPAWNFATIPASLAAKTEGKSGSSPEKLGEAGSKGSAPAETEGGCRGACAGRCRIGTTYSTSRSSLEGWCTRRSQVRRDGMRAGSVQLSSGDDGCRSANVYRWRSSGCGCKHVALPA